MGGEERERESAREREKEREREREREREKESVWVCALVCVRGRERERARVRAMANRTGSQLRCNSRRFERGPHKGRRHRRKAGKIMAWRDGRHSPKTSDRVGCHGDLQHHVHPERLDHPRRKEKENRLADAGEE